MGYESVIDVPDAGTVAAPGHEEALAELEAEVERLRRALRLACEDLGKYYCPKDPDAYFGKLTDAHCMMVCNLRRPDCLVQKYLAEAAKADDAQ